jgi:hypothetical protein
MLSFTIKYHRASDIHKNGTTSCEQYHARSFKSQMTRIRQSAILAVSMALLSMFVDKRPHSSTLHLIRLIRIYHSAMQMSEREMTIHENLQNSI